MDYLKDDEVFEGAIIRIERNEKLEGYARLIEPTGAYLPFYEDNNKLMIRQRWLVHWLHIDELDSKIELSSAERMTQHGIAGNKAHRNIEFYAGKSWDGYEKPDEDDSYDKLIDDFGGAF